MSKSKFRTIFDHPRAVTVVEGDSLARAEFADECDIRNIIARHSLAPSTPPRYLDLTLFGDGLQETLEFARYIAGEFDALPLAARQFFDYDPDKLVSFLADDGNRDKAIELGLLPPTATPVTSATSSNEPVNKE